MSVWPILAVPSAAVHVELVAFVAPIMFIEELTFILCERQWASFRMVVIPVIGAVVEGALVIILVPIVAIVVYSCVFAVLAIAIVVTCLSVSTVLIVVIVVMVFVSVVLIMISIVPVMI